MYNEIIDNHPGALPQRKSSLHLFSVLQFSFSLIALVAVWGVALITVLVGLFSALEGSIDPRDSLPLLLITASAFTGGLLLVPSVVLSIRRIINRPARGPAKFSQQRWPAFIILFLPVILAFGHLAATRTGPSWILLPPMHVLAVILPVIWLAYLAVRGLSLGSPQRAWGVFGSGLALGPVLILFSELVLIILFVVLGVLYISGDSELSRAILSLSEELSQGTPDPERLTQLLTPYLASPLLISAAFAFIAGLVPLVEEALKPIGVWLLIGRPLSPGEGFAAGALSGAGFAIFESLAAGATDETWTILVVARIGTAIIHILTTSLMGWALVLAWRQKRYLRLLGTYLGVVILHGAWNALTINYTFTGIFEELQLSASNVLPRLGSITPLILSAFAALAFAALLLLNRQLRSREYPQAGMQTETPLGEIGEEPQDVL